MQLANTLFSAAPAGSKGYQLRKLGCPHGNGVFRFPVPHRITKHSDNTIRDTPFYQLLPFEPPRVPWAGIYEVLFYIPERGLVAPAHPEHQTVYVQSVVPRAAWDKQALCKFVPAQEGCLAGTSEDLAQAILERAPQDAFGYRLFTERSPYGVGHFVFPVQGKATRRADGSLSELPHFSLTPYESPMVPWAGFYILLYCLPNQPPSADPAPERRTLYVGHIYPHAEYDRSAHLPIIEITEADQVSELARRRPIKQLRGLRGPRR